MYIPRYIESTILALHKHFKVVYLGGPRQVGKTTVLKHLSDKLGISYITLDDLELRDLAKRDPNLFLDRFPPPLYIDEAQYAPNLFSAIKIRVDRSAERGIFWLSGSQNFPLLKGLQESLAGRVGIASLAGLSLAEEEQIRRSNFPFLPVRVQEKIPLLSARGIFNRIVRGSYPALASDPSIGLQFFYSSYVQTYLDRDVRDIFGVEKMGLFKTVLELVAARTGQILNISDLARDAGVSVNAARGWISILESSGIIYLLRPYFRNISKRIIKAPKIYMLDTGLAAYLTKWKTAETVEAGAMAGAFFETYVISEIIKSYIFRGFEPPLYYFRDREGHEVDVIIEEEQKVYPVEIKMKATINENDLGGIRFVKKIFKQSSQAAIITLGGRCLPYDREIAIIPANAIQ